MDRVAGMTMTRRCADRIFYGTLLAIHLANCVVSKGDLAYMISGTLFLGFGHILWRKM